MFYFIPSYVFMIVFGVLGFIGCVFLLVRFYVRIASQKKLGRSVVAMGNMRGKNYKEFVATMGGPDKTEMKTDASGTYKLATWCAGGYTIVIRFDANDVVVRVEHEELKGIEM